MEAPPAAEVALWPKRARKRAEAGCVVRASFRSRIASSQTFRAAAFHRSISAPRPSGPTVPRWTRPGWAAGVEGASYGLLRPNAGGMGTGTAARAASGTRSAERARFGRFPTVRFEQGWRDERVCPRRERRFRIRHRVRPPPAASKFFQKISRAPRARRRRCAPGAALQPRTG